MSKKYIIEKIQEITDGDMPPGIEKFEKITGIKRHEVNKYWETWGEALIEAGYQPNRFGTEALSKTQIIEKIIELIREKKKFPTGRTLRIKKNADASFPSATTVLNKIGTIEEQVNAVVSFCQNKYAYEDILEICKNVPVQSRTKKSDNSKDLLVGYVYLIKFGDFFKIGRSNDFDRRLSEIKTKLPEEGELIHVIETDDPEGIEAYWHNRFKDRRARGEWFKLSNDDVKVLRKRKFM